MSNTIHIKGLRGTIYKRGKDSYRVQLSLGRNAEGKYDIKRETIRGTEQDAIDLLTRWNVEYLDNTIIASNHQTVKQAYEEWIEFIREYRKPNTHRFYRERFESDILPMIGHRRLKDIKLSDLQKIMKEYPTKDKHNKRALSAFWGWCKKHKKVRENICRDLETQAKPKEQTEDDVWSWEEVQKMYKHLTFKNLYDIFIVLGVECGLRPQETLALTWDDIFEDHLAIEKAVIERAPGVFELGPPKDRKARYPVITPFVTERLRFHKAEQNRRILKTKGYNRENNLVVADKMGNVPDLKYIRRYMLAKAKEAGVSPIPPKNLRSTHISLLNDLGVPLPTIQKQAGHAANSKVTKDNYIRTYHASMKRAAMEMHEKLHS
ncbi:MAG: tyrosine-type recombinase/integrase [Limnochordia bacterium]